jgi:hypothetical protein
MLARTLRSPTPGTAPAARGRGAAKAPGIPGAEVDMEGLAVVAEPRGKVAKAAPVEGRSCNPASLSDPDPEP